MEPSSPTPTPEPQPLETEGFISQLLHNEALLKVLDILIAIVVFGATVAFVASMALQGDPSYLFNIPLAIIAGFLVSLLVKPNTTTRADFLRTLKWRQLTVIGLIVVAVIFGAWTAIYYSGFPSHLSASDIIGLVGYLAVIALLSAMTVLVLFITHWRTSQPASLLFGIGQATRVLAQIVAGVIIGFLAFAAYFITNLTLDPPDE